jgi:hypothetical protein
VDREPPPPWLWLPVSAAEWVVGTASVDLFREFYTVTQDIHIEHSGDNVLHAWIVGDDDWPA